MKTQFSTVAERSISVKLINVCKINSVIDQLLLVIKHFSLSWSHIYIHITNLIFLFFSLCFTVHTLKNPNYYNITIKLMIKLGIILLLMENI